jgi:peptide/nickel transport system substrate-binding protein
MQNRFGIKDFFLFALIVVLGVLVVLAMKQYDRQLNVLRQINDKMELQTRELSDLNRVLSSGGFAGGMPTTQGSQFASTRDPKLDAVFAPIRAAQQMPGYARGDWYVDIFPVKVPTLTAFIVQDLYGMYVNARVCEWLLAYDPYTLEYVPLLAESWTTSEDGLLVTFKLRRNVRFSDGTPMTADDVVFTFEWIMNPKVAAARTRSVLEKLQRVEKTGDYEVAFHFKEPYYDSAGTVGSVEIVPRHFVSKYTPEQYNQTPGLLMGTGPYRLRNPASWRPGERIELVRNERYWGEPGPWDRIIWHEIENETASETMFKNKEVDAFAATPEQFNELSQDQNLLKWARPLKYVAPTSGYSYAAWNQQRNGKPTHFAEKRVRQAMTMLVDRARFVKEVWYGHGQVGNGPFSPLSGQLDPKVQPWPFDPERAKSLLREAGYEDRNGDGVIESKAGEPFRFSLVYSSKGVIGERIALFLKDSYARAGIVMTPDPQDWPIMMTKLNERDFDAITLAWGTSVESDIFQMFHSVQIKDQGDNFMHYVNPELDKAIEAARTTIDKSKRMPLWHECHRIIHEDQPYTFLVERFSLGFQDSRVQNVETSKLGLNFNNRYSMPIPWYVPKTMQKWK